MPDGASISPARRSCNYLAASSASKARRLSMLLIGFRRLVGAAAHSVFAFIEAVRNIGNGFC